MMNSLIEATKDFLEITGIFVFVTIAIVTANVALYFIIAGIITILNKAVS